MAFIITGPSQEEIIALLGILLLIIQISWNLYVLWTIFKNKQDIAELKEDLRRLKRLDFLKER
jgi:hypothetical protein